MIHRMTKSLRPGKVFVDWSQNAARKTTATPYTLRARREPSVSAPVTWEEVAECRSPAALAFLAGDLAPRLQDYGDLFSGLLLPEWVGGLPCGGLLSGVWRTGGGGWARGSPRP